MATAVLVGASRRAAASVGRKPRATRRRPGGWRSRSKPTSRVLDTWRRRRPVSSSAPTV
uniref:Uncharacterized protein n=1 Tax=Arundo donax TaxID=35708 RepID=A0A0A9BGE1_ARUDO